MARIIYSGLVTEIRGKIGGTVFQSNKHGYTVKNKANVVKPASTEQNFIKNRFSMAVTAWASAAQSTRDNWNAWAAANPQYSKYNPSSQLSGYEVFVKWHMLFFRLSDTLEISPSGSLLTTPVFNPTAEANSGAIRITPNVINGVLGIITNVSCYPIVQASQNFIGTKPRYANVFNVTDTYFYVSTDFCNRFGFTPIAGAWVYIRLQSWQLNNGQIFAPQDFKLHLT